MREVTREIVSGVIVSSDNKILMGQKASGGVYQDCLHLPGGGVHVGETKEEALAREMLEEVGIDIAERTIVLLDDEGKGSSEKTDSETGETYLCHMLFNVYRIDLAQASDDIEVKLSDDLIAYQWIKLDEVQTHKLTPPSVELFARLGYGK